LLPYVGVIALVLSVANSIYQRKKDQQGDWTAKINDAVAPYRGLPEALSEIRAELQVLKKQVEVFWKGVSFSSAQALHSPHTKELDALLEKFQRDEIQSEKDLQKLKSMLTDVVNNDSSPLRRKFALDILTLIHVRFEIGGDLITSLRQQDRGLQDSINNFSRRLKE
jgi:uncharacterized protein involved in exopolysaccharide biosynthesis